MKYKIIYSKLILKQLKKIKKSGKDIDKFKKVVSMLATGIKLPPKYKDHALIGNYQGFRDCHIEPDWILIYEINNNTLLLYLSETGSHSDLF